MSPRHAIDQSDRVVGYSNNTVQFDAFLWDQAGIHDLGTLGGNTSFASSINSVGQVVGTSRISNSLDEHFFLWESGSMRDLGAFGAAQPYAINDAGQIVGDSYGPNSHAFLLSNGSVVDLGTLGGFQEFPSSAFAINNSGQIVGNATIGGAPPPGCAPNQAVSHAFLWEGGQMTDLAPPGTCNSGAQDINSSGQIVGTICGSIGPSVFPTTCAAAIWENGAASDLNSRLDDSASGWTLLSSYAINDSGQILVDATRNGQGASLLLTPVASTPPPPVVQFGAGSIVTSTPSVALADGVSDASIAVTLFDSAGRPLLGRTVQFNTSLGRLSTPPTTNTSGVTSVTLTSGSAGVANVSAVDQATGIAIGSVRVTFLSSLPQTPFACPGAIPGVSFPFPATAELGWLYREPNPPSADTRDYLGKTPMPHNGIDVWSRGGGGYGDTVYAPLTGTVDRSRSNGSNMYIYSPNIRATWPDGSVHTGLRVYVGLMHGLTVQDKQEVMAGITPIGLEGLYSSTPPDPNPKDTGYNADYFHVHISFGSQTAPALVDGRVETTWDPSPYLGGDVSWGRFLREYGVNSAPAWNLNQWCEASSGPAQVPPHTAVVTVEPGTSQTMTIPGGRGSITFPGDLTQPPQELTFTYTELGVPQDGTGQAFQFAGTGLQFVGPAFRLTAVDASGNPVTTFTGDTYQITLNYTDSDWRGAGIPLNQESSLHLYYLQGGAWQNTGVSPNTTINTITVPLNHLTDFALLGAAAVPDTTRPRQPQA